MNLILLMVFMALALSVGFVISYLWALSSGQFDDLETPALRMLKDDSIIAKHKKEGSSNE